MFIEHSAPVLLGCAVPGNPPARFSPFGIAFEVLCPRSQTLHEWGLQHLRSFLVTCNELRGSHPSSVTPAFASLTLCLPAVPLVQQQDPKTRSLDAEGTFSAIDRGRKGYINEADLQQYAKEQGLPAGYAALFLQVAQQSAAKRQLLGIRAQRDPVEEGHLAFADFEKFVMSREEGLRKAFTRLDVDGTGQLTRDSLLQALSSVTIECNKSGNTYRCQDKCVNRLLTSMAGQRVLGNGATVSYDQFQRFFMLLPQQELLVDYWLSAACPARCDVGGCVVLRDDEKGQATAAGHLLAGALAGAVSRTATAPLETIRLQSMTGARASRPISMVTAAQAIMAQGGGWKALFRGNGVNVLKSAPQKALDFFAFEAFKGAPWLTAWAGPGSSLSTLLAAGMAGATSMTVLYPLEVVRSRVTCDPHFGQHNVGSALRLIASREGPAALYRGWLPSVSAIIPEAAICYGCFDLLKAAYAGVTQQREAGVAASLACGVAASCLGQLVSYPLETVSRRMQVAAAGQRLQPWAVAQGIISTEGPGALYRGLGPASARTIPMALLSFGTYELVKRWMLHWDSSRQPLPMPRSSACGSAGSGPSARQRNVAAIRQSLIRHTKSVKS